jgi:hypothetical protein
MEKIFNIRIFKVLISLGITATLVSFILTLIFTYFLYKTSPNDNELKQGNLTIKNSSASSIQFPLKTTQFSVPEDLIFSSDHKTFIPKEVSGKFGIYLNYGDSQNPLIVLTFMYLIVAFVSIMWILLLLRKVIINVEKGEIFTNENIIRLKILGIVSLIYPMYKVLESQILVQLIFRKLTLPHGFAPDIASQKEITFACVILTFVFFIMASIFQYGKKLKDDQELTI